MFILCLLATLPGGRTAAYEPVELTWRNGSTSFYYGDLGSPWKEAFIEAAARWRDTPANITVELKDLSSDQSCDQDGINATWWSDSDCGEAWDDSTLAVTQWWYYTDTNEMVEADIYFNSTIDWSVYDGDWRSSHDFRRAAVHELGHAYGLNHSNSSNSIMRRFTGDIFLPQQDDIDALGTGGNYGYDTEHNLQIEIAGNGVVQVDPRVAGTLVGNGGNLDCTSDCARRLQDGLRLDVFAQACNGESFLGWEGIPGCSTRPGCQLAALDSGRTIRAVFSGENGNSSALSQAQAFGATDMKLADKIRITWDGVCGGAEYQLRRKKQGGAYRTIATVETTEYVDRRRIPLRQYQYQVRACNRAGCGPWSSADDGMARFQKPAKKEATQGKFGNRVTTTWNKVSYATFYEVRRSRQSSDGYALIASPERPKHVDRDVTPGTPYYYKVRACNEYGCSGSSNPVMGFAR